MAASGVREPVVGEDGLISEPHTLSVVLKCLPRDVRCSGPRRQTVVLTCFDVSDQYLAVGSQQGYVWILDLHATRLVRELSDFRGADISVVSLNAAHERIAFSTSDGQTKVESFTKQMSKGYRIQEKDRQSVVAMTWDQTGTSLLCAYSSGKLIKISFQFAGEAMEVSPVLECGSRVVQLSVCGPRLLISTLARSLLLDVGSGRVTQVGTKERKPGSFGGCLSGSDEEGEAMAYLARPGLRMWTADETGKVVLTTKFRDALSSGQFPCVPTHNWSSGSSPQFADSLWQFSLVIPWLRSFVVTYHDRTLCVLDPTASAVAGVLCLGHEITSVATNGKFVYVLCSGSARPMARFTAHAAYLKTVQKTKTSAANKTEDDDTESVTAGAVEDDRPMEGEGLTTDDGGGGGGDEDMVRFELRGLTCEEEGSTPTSPPGTETPSSLLSPPPPSISSQDREYHQTHTTPHGMLDTQTDGSNEKPRDMSLIINSPSAGDVVDMFTTSVPAPTLQENERRPDTVNKEEAEQCTEGRDMENQSEATPGEHISTTAEADPFSLEETPDIETAPLSTPEPPGHHHRCLEDQIETRDDSGSRSEPVFLDHSEPTTTGSSSGSTEQQHHTTRDPPSVTGPVAMQDLARDVTELLRPALGKLSTFMMRRPAGNSSGTATPPLVDHSEERERGGGRAKGEGTATEGQAAPSPRLMLKLGGRLGELISGDRDKEREAYSPSPPVPIEPEEEERRLRMAQAADEEDSVSERLTQRKRRKRRTKKHSPRSNSTSPSLEKLTDIGDVKDDMHMQLESPHVEPTPETTKEEVLSVVTETDGEMVLPSQDLGHEEEPGGGATGKHDSIEEETLTIGQKIPSDNLEHPEDPPLTTALDASEATREVGEKPDYLTTPDVSERENEGPPPTPHPVEEFLLTVAPGAVITGDGAVDDETLLLEVEAVASLLLHEESSSEVTSNSDTLQEHSKEPASAGNQKTVARLEVTRLSDPLSQTNDDGKAYLEPNHDRLLTQSTTREPTQPQHTRDCSDNNKTESSDGLQFILGDEVQLELSDNPLYKDDTSDFTTTDTESRSRRSSSAKLQSSSRGSSVAPPTFSPSASAFAAKHVRSKGAASLGVSHAVSDHSWESSLPVPSRPRSDRLFTPSASPFEVSHSPRELSSSFQSSYNNTVTRNKSPASSKQPLSLPATVNLLKEQGRSSREDSGSDFSCDENEAMPIEPEHFSLCAAAVDTNSPRSSSRESKVVLAAAKKSPSPHPVLPPRHPQELGSTDEQEEETEESSPPDPEADIWVTVPHPCRGHVQSICLSDHLLWLVDSRNMVYCTEINTKGKKWELIKHPMQQVSSSSAGCAVWGVYRQNAYVRIGLESSAVGNTWKNATKNTSLAQKIKSVCADNIGVWAVKIDGQIIFRKGVTAVAPFGRVWVEVGRAAGFMSVTSCAGVVWATNSSGRLFYRDGITGENPSGRKWVDMKAPPLEAVCMTQGNIAWIIDGEGKMGFRCGVSRSQPTGKNPWWEVTVSTTLAHSSLPFNSLWQVMTSEGSQFLSSVSSLIHTHLPGHHKLLAVSASNRAGVCVLESGSKLHACWRSTTGYHYSSASKDGVFQLTTWTMFGSGSTGLWVVRDDGELYCITPQDKFVRIECASTIQMMAVSSTALWVIANNQLWSRQGMTAGIPEGISWDYIELSPHLHQRKLKHIVCGKRAVWAVDGTGVPHFRFGVHSREPGTGMSPAWVPVDDLSHPLHQITVSNNDWLVWACDDNCNCYVRTGVTPDFPVGEAWDIVPGQSVKQLCAHGRKVYALTPSGNLLCRYGITERNVQGNYWRQLPGNFVQITVGHGGVLLGLDAKGSILRQQSKTLTVTQDSEFLRHRFDEGLDPSWEVV